MYVRKKVDVFSVTKVGKFSRPYVHMYIHIGHIVQQEVKVVLTKRSSSTKKRAMIAKILFAKKVQILVPFSFRHRFCS
jgi:hypothetical protein